MKRFGQYSLMFVCALTISTVSAQEWKSGVEWQKPPVVTPGESDNQAPSDAIVLFDGTDLSQWNNGDQWLIQDGCAIPKKTNIQTKQSFGDIQLHIEWSAPTEIEGSGQGRGNSGVFLMDLYEVQVLDSFENETYFDGQAASIYKQTPPLVNAMRKPGEWNSYDIFFTAPTFHSNGDVKTKAYVTIVHNGVLALNHFELFGPTSYTEAPHYKPHAETGPISLQFHNDPVRFRNIWVRELKPAVGRRVSAPFNIEKPKRPAKKQNEQKGQKPDEETNPGDVADDKDEPAKPAEEEGAAESEEPKANESNSKKGDEL